MLWEYILCNVDCVEVCKMIEVFLSKTITKRVIFFAGLCWL